MLYFKRADNGKGSLWIDEVSGLLERGVIEVAPLAFMSRSSVTAGNRRRSSPLSGAPEICASRVPCRG